MVAVTAVAVTIIGGGGPATAAAPAALSVVTQAMTQAEADRVFVQWLAKSDPRKGVRVAAWNALLSSKSDAAIAAFLHPGKDANGKETRSGLSYAIERAGTSRQRNIDFVDRVVAIYLPMDWPYVHAAALYARDGSHADRTAFVQEGYKAAKEKDQEIRAEAAKHTAARVQADREFVITHLRDNDHHGPQVRGAAAYATRDNAPHGDLVEFFAFEWASAAAADLLMYRTRYANDDAVWRATINRLVAEATAAEKAARETGEEAKRQEAALAWRTVGQTAGPAQVAWAGAEQVALTQAQVWQNVAQAAGSASASHWDPIAGAAPVTAEQWADEQKNAAEQAAYWTGQYQRALAAELAMQTPAAG
jgi:hypothetical protein